MPRRKKIKPYVHPLDIWIIKQCKKNGGVKIFGGSSEFEAWRKWRLHNKLKTAAMIKAARENRAYIVPTQFPIYPTKEKK